MDDRIILVIDGLSNERKEFNTFSPVRDSRSSRLNTLRLAFVFKGSYDEGLPTLSACNLSSQDSSRRRTMVCVPVSLVACVSVRCG